MRRHSLIVVLATLILVSPSFGHEREVQRTDLPAAVERAVARETQGATIRGYSEETVQGRRFYEVELTVDGHSKNLKMDANGTVLEVEEDVALDILPAAVSGGLAAKAGEAKILKVESLSKAGKIVAYEAQIQTAGKKSEIQVGPDGTNLGEEE